MPTDHPNPDDLRAKVFRDRVDRDRWRVEKMDEDGGYECVEVFAGPNALQRAIDYARHRFGDFDVIELAPLLALKRTNPSRRAYIRQTKESSPALRVPESE
jgi:hypothetical protein